MFRDIPGWEGYYEVSSAGVVRSVPRTITFSDGRLRAYPRHTLTTYIDGFGYLKVTLKGAGIAQRVHVHHLVALTFHGPRPDGLQIRHLNGQRTDNRARNLRYGTAAENRADMMRHGTANPRRTFSDEVVAAIRDARGVVPGVELAKRYGVSRAHICNIQLGNRRKG